MKKNIDKHILKQTRRKLGSVEVSKFKSVFFDIKQAKEDVGIDIQNIVWIKKCYTFNRGDKFNIALNFYEYEGNKLDQEFVSNDSGGCYDGSIEKYTNAVYRVRVYSDADREVTLPIKVDDLINLTVIKEEFSSSDDYWGPMTVIISSGENYYVSGDVRFTLKAETWTTLYIFAYFFKSNSFVNIFNGLLDNIDRWAIAEDKIIDDTPKWYDPPLTTSLNEVSLTTVNALRWFVPEENDWAGHLIYSRRTVDITEFIEAPKDV